VSSSKTEINTFSGINQMLIPPRLTHYNDKKQAFVASPFKASRWRD
jgi:hypothetical protein